MDSLKLHQLINYYPAIGMVLGSIVLAVGLVRSNGRARRFGLRVVVFVALLTVLVVFTGEFASWERTATSGPSSEALSNHKLMGTAAFAVTTLAGIAAFVAIRRTRSPGRDGRWALMTAFALAVAASVLLTTTVFRGRQVKWAGAVIPPMAATQMTSRPPAGETKPSKINQVDKRR